MKPTPEQIKKFDEENESEVDNWEKGDFGKNPKHAKRIPEAESALIKKKIAETKAQKGLPTSIRLPPELIAELTKLAAACGMGYQTYLRMVLTKHVSDIARKEKKKHTA
ncbi:MAG: CopG antitoxin of type toxin-antitoxin system [Pseudomonadota bacterium]|jgi:predicted DNA binding CopG/RHH family protein